HEVLLIRKIRELLYEQGFTISGARNRLDDNAHDERPAPRAAAVAANDPAAVNGDGKRVKAVDIGALYSELAAIRKLLRSTHK
ncbi:MAG TPA: MerR family transcriptional regulator, partial [Burkholderiaceae bacterium]|nr:MerR family transcriptional regulator [Burkholderiaceae bacterium]